jgi:leader peptidase (prepilin peptidase)/N-methyltransferase
MDWETKLVSEAMVAVWGGLVVILNMTNMSYMTYMWGAVVGVGVIGGIWAASRGRAMGFGDVEISAVMGWWLGWPGVAVALWVAFVSGAIVGLICLIGRIGQIKGLKSEMAFGPFLILGSWVALLWGGKLITWIFPF